MGLLSNILETGGNINNATRDPQFYAGMAQKLGQLLSTPTENLSQKQMGRMSHEDLWRMRENALDQGNQQLDQQIAPYEHRAFTRQFVQDSPVLGTLSSAAAIPVYYGAKATGLDRLITGDQYSSPPSLDQMREAYKGIGEGLLGLLSK